MTNPAVAPITEATCPGAESGAVLLVLAWAAHSGVALAPKGKAGIGVHSRDEHFQFPPDVADALAVHWRAVRERVDATHRSLATRGLASWPNIETALLTVLTWTDAVSERFGSDTTMDYEERAAIAEHDGGLPRWLAEANAVEYIVRRRLAPLAKVKVDAPDAVDATQKRACGATLPVEALSLPGGPMRFGRSRSFRRP